MKGKTKSRQRGYSKKGICWMEEFDRDTGANKSVWAQY